MSNIQACHAEGRRRCIPVSTGALVDTWMYVSTNHKTLCDIYWLFHLLQVPNMLSACTTEPLW
jgi:hypothetical protein